MYNAIYGTNPATFIILPMLGKHPDMYPRFRDCFIGKLTNSNTDRDSFGIPLKDRDEQNVISVYTRVGGGNREEYQEEINTLRKSKYYIEDYDDDFDTTYATFIFSVPKKWKKDFHLIKEGKLTEISTEYKKELYDIFPKLKDEFDKIFIS